MRALSLLILLSSCSINPLMNRGQHDWNYVLKDPVLNPLLDETYVSSSMISSVYVQLRGLQQRQNLLQKHIDNQEELISLTSDLVNRGIASSIDLQTLISFQGTLKAGFYKLQTEMDKLLYQLALLVDETPSCLAFRLCQESPLPIRLLDVPCGSCTDLLSYYNNEARVAALSQSQEAAQLAHDMTIDLYQRGLKSSIDVISAHRTLITAEDDLIQAQVDLLSDYITLYNNY